MMEAKINLQIKSFRNRWSHHWRIDILNIKIFVVFAVPIFCCLFIYTHWAVSVLSYDIRDQRHNRKRGKNINDRSEHISITHQKRRKIAFFCALKRFCAEKDPSTNFRCLLGQTFLQLSIIETTFKT